jgi:hypothetical protein
MVVEDEEWEWCLGIGGRSQGKGEAGGVPGGPA